MTKDEALKLALEALERIKQETFHPAKVFDHNHAITAIREALAQPAQQEGCQCPACQVLPHASDCAVHNGPAYPKGKCDCGVQQEPEFFAHSVDQPYDWSEWVCPDPKSYLMKCCDCGLVHEAQFGVVRYKSETEREDCDPVEDPNLQAVFRMRRSEQWSPADTAYRPGGLAQPEGCQCPACKVTPHASDCAVHNEPAYPKGACNCGAQPEQEPFGYFRYDLRLDAWVQNREGRPGTPFYTTPPQRKPLTNEEIEDIWNRYCDEMGEASINDAYEIARAIEAAVWEKQK